MMLLREKTTLITPVALLNALMDPPMPEIPELAQTVVSFSLFNVGSAYYLKGRLTLTQVQSTLPDT